MRPITPTHPALSTDEPVALRGVSWRSGGRTLVDDVTFSLRAGEVLAIVGPNGAGKSTLLRLIAGDIAPTAGEVLIDGRRLADWSLADLARVRAVLPQQTVLQFAFTAAEVVAMGRAARRGRRDFAADDAIVSRALRQTDATHLAHRIYPSLSGGEQSRVGLARVLAQDTPVLLLDEPTAALDLHHQQVVMRVARDLAAGGAAVLAILHDLNLAAAHADRIALLSAGRLAALGAPAEVLTADRLGQVFACPVVVIPHPVLDCPLVLPLPAMPAGVGPAPAEPVA